MADRLEQPRLVLASASARRLDLLRGVGLAPDATSRPKVMKTGAADKTRGARRRRKRGCPNCGEPPAPRFRSFCSRHCADLDLGRWLGGAYAIPTEEAPGEAPEEAPDGAATGEEEG